MDKSLRLVMATIVTESKLTKETKLQLLKFIKEQATDSQIKALLMDGEIVQLDEQSEQVVNERFSSFDVNKFIKLAAQKLRKMKK